MSDALFIHDAKTVTIKEKREEKHSAGQPYWVQKILIEKTNNEELELTIFSQVPMEVKTPKQKSPPVAIDDNDPNDKCIICGDPGADTGYMNHPAHQLCVDEFHEDVSALDIDTVAYAIKHRLCEEK